MQVKRYKGEAAVLEWKGGSAKERGHLKGREAAQAEAKSLEGRIVQRNAVWAVGPEWGRGGGGVEIPR